ncbi:hypothetical protein PRIPAC_88236 [Pristionchus pacificus]|uniref:Uncharacterized protein n=1 Tax=Pristionchus pacificus TaxID=54126 RepID=A0A2A6B7B7_PRIPA|nr:hypothetical protein PRIPAC_88236 [Pristionchus pacificus]|eukprot:PDM61772.1 hypothetical protein PRIPAC_51214 [Pristionchus pacificus]
MLVAFRSKLGGKEKSGRRIVLSHQFSFDTEYSQSRVKKQCIREEKNCAQIICSIRCNQTHASSEKEYPLSTMGGEQSRLNQQHELYKAQLHEMRRQEAMNEEQRRRQADELTAQALASQKRAAEREEQLRESIRRIEEEQLKRAQEQSVNSFHDELMKEYDSKIKEKNDELHIIQMESMKEMEALKKEQEEKNKSHLEDLSKIHDKIMKLDETHTETMKKLLEERNVERKEAQMEIISANRQFHEATYNMIKSRSETTAITMAILNNVVAKGALEKDSNCLKAKIEAMKHVVSRMEEDRRKIVDWLVEIDMKKEKKGLNALISRGNHEKTETAQSYLKSMAVDCSLLDSLIKETALLLSNSIFDRELIEKAKGSLNFGQGVVADLFDAIAKIRVEVVKNPRSVSLDAIKVCIKNLDLALNSVPEMVTQSTNEYIHDEMKKLQINEQQFMNNNALTMNFENPAVKDVPEEH